MGGIVSSIFGGGNDYKEPDSSKIAAQMAQQLWSETGGVRKPVWSGLENFMNGNWDIGTSPMWASGKNAIESQYGTARDNILANTATGGATTQALSNLEGQRAGGFTDLVSNIQNDMYNKAYGVATNTPQTSISGLLGSANASTNAMQAQSQAEAGKSQMTGSLGQGLGMFLGGK